MTDPIVQSPAGLYCPAGDFHVDPWGRADRAIITHAHGDHARAGSRRYLALPECVPLLKARLGHDLAVEALPEGRTIQLKDARVSLHPAGHILGSAQVRIETPAGVAVVSGDYKRAFDPTCRPFEPVRCNWFMTESTFGLPVYRWGDSAGVFDEINRWWRSNRDGGVCSIVFAYSLGKAQRVLAGIDPSIGPILAHRAVLNMIDLYRAAGVSLPPVEWAGPDAIASYKSAALVLAPPSANGSPWMRRFRPFSSAIASGWMRVRGRRRRRAVDRGFVLSDHADWGELNRTIDEAGAETIAVTHGYTDTFAKWLRSRGRTAVTFETRFTGEGLDDPAADPHEPGDGSAA